MKRFLLFILITGCIFPVQAQFNWQYTGGPEGGAMTEIYNNDDYAFCMDEHSLYRSSDGISWKTLPQEGPIWPLAVHGSTLVGRFYTGWATDPYFPTTLKVSHGNGETWQQSGKLPYYSVISNIVVCSHGIYVSDGNQYIIYRSRDEGLIWDTLFPPLQYGHQLWSYEDRLYVSNQFHLYRTDSNGENWTNIMPPTSGGEYFRNIFAHGPHLLVGSDFKLWQSHDNGQSWNESSMYWPGNSVLFSLSGNELFATNGPSGLYFIYGRRG